eukprot:m.580986 g.580986  ORF g.580986 m.580986 type:complete len:181 (-) comp22326_c1_seq9:3343-3885(-)
MAATISAVLSCGAQQLMSPGDLITGAPVYNDSSSEGFEKCYLLTVQMGLEPVVAAECKETIRDILGTNESGVRIAQKWPAPGYVAVSLSGSFPNVEEVCARLLTLRCIHDVLHYHVHFTIELPDTKLARKSRSTEKACQQQQGVDNSDVVTVGGAVDNRCGTAIVVIVVEGTFKVFLGRH